MITDSLVLYCKLFKPKIKQLLIDGVIKRYEVPELLKLAYGDLKCESISSGHAAVEHKLVGQRPSIEEPKASRYKEKYTQLSLEL